MTKAILLYIDHVEVGDNMTWATTPEEVLGGTGRCTLFVQDRTNTWEPECHWDVKLVIASSGWVLYRGEINSEPVELPTGMPWRTWALDCADYNGEIPNRLVGAIDGNTWLKVDELGDYVPIDPYANSVGTDRLTIQALFDHYFRVDGEAAETDTYVSELLPVDSFQILYWNYSNLKAALDELASLVVSNLQYWLDPLLFVHWAAIPAWQELAQADIGSLARMLPESLSILDAAPTNLSGNVTLAGDEVGCRELKFTFDGSQMPEQVYIKGGTGFTYDDGVDRLAVETPPVVKKYPGRYKIVIHSSTKIWRKDSTGYISLTFDYIGACTVYANLIQVPWNVARHKGGGFYKMTTGPKIGWLLDNDTNYFGYGSITVTKLPAGYTGTGTPPPPPPPVPTIGVGGTGWANSVLQDPNKRQIYLEAPSSTDQATRDSFGSQVLYRGQYPTLRGSLKVSGTDGWRVGQIFRLADDRLPVALNGKYFVIQRVAAALFAETDIREYVLDWGDGPSQRISASGPRKPYTPPPAVLLVVTAVDLTPLPGSTQTITAQLADASGAPWKIADKAVHWEVLAYDLAGALVNGQGTISPEDSFTDRDGKARTNLTAGTRRDIQYFVWATTPVL